MSTSGPRPSAGPRSADRATRRAAITLGAGGVLAVLVLLATGTQGARLLLIVAALVMAVALLPRGWALGVVVIGGGASIIVYGGLSLFVVANAVQGVPGASPPDMDTFAAGTTVALMCWIVAVGAAAFDLARGRWRLLIAVVTTALTLVAVAWWFVA